MQPSSDPRSGAERLVAGRDYPRTYREFVEMFPDAAACIRYVEQLRWPHGFILPVVRNEWRSVAHKPGAATDADVSHGYQWARHNI